MLKSRERILRVLQFQIDLTLVAVAWILSYWVRFSTFLPVSKGIPEEVHYFKLIPFIIIIWALVFWLSGVLRKIGSYKTLTHEILDTLRVCFLAAVCFLGFTYFYNEFRYSRLMILLFASFHPILIIMGRAFARRLFTLYLSKSPSRKVTLVCEGVRLEHAIGIASIAGLGDTEISTVIPVGKPDEQNRCRILAKAKGLTCTSAPKSWIDFFTEFPSEMVVVALSLPTLTEFGPDLTEISDQVPNVTVVPDFTPTLTSVSRVEVIDGQPTFVIHASPLEGAGVVYKRLFDICGGVLALVLFSPIMLLTALVIKMTSSGPILYAQERMGLDGRVFTIFKFRTMRVDSEINGAVFAHKNDARTTICGKLLRRSSLDELPQLFNVIRGDMSLVGPRPERPFFVNQFRRQIPQYMLRHKVKAGITGWAQINGWRGNTSIEKRIECDLYYIRNWSLWVDIKILWFTIFKGFFSPNAY